MDGATMMNEMLTNYGDYAMDNGDYMMDTANQMADMGNNMSSGLNFMGGDVFSTINSILVGASFVLTAIFLIMGVIYLVSQFFVYKKLGIAGWKSLIPIYGKACLSTRLFGSATWGIFAALICVPVLNFIALIAIWHLIFNIFDDRGFDVENPDLWALFYICVPLIGMPVVAFSSKFNTNGGVSQNRQIAVDDEDEDVDDEDDEDDDDDDDDDEPVAPVKKQMSQMRKNSGTSSPKGSKIDQLMAATIYEDGKVVNFEDDDEKRDFISEVLDSADYKVQVKRDGNRVTKANFIYLGED